MRKQLLTKMLLIAAALFMGTSAWADTFTFNEKDYTIVYSDDFTDAENYAKYASIGNTSRCEAVQYNRTDIKGDDVKALVMYEYTNQNASNCFYNLFTSAESGIATYKTSEDYAVTFDWSLAYGYNQQSSFIIKNAAGSELIKFLAGKSSTNGEIYLNGSATADAAKFSPNPTYGYNNHVVPAFTQFYTITIWANKTDGTKLKMVNQKDATDTHIFTLSDDVVYLGQMQFGSGRYYAGVCIDNIKVGIYSETEIVPNPTAAITGVNGTDRIVTLTLGTGSADGTTLAYSTNSDMSEATTYTLPFTVSSTCTIYFQSTSPTSAKSEIQSINVTCEVVKLNTPVISRSGNTVTITQDQSNLDASPSATIYYTYGAGDPVAYSSAITVEADATITAYATATGYTNSDNATRAVALFPTNVAQVINAPENNTYTTGALSGVDVVGTNATFQALMIDGVQWGGADVFVQSTKFGFRNGGAGKDWYFDDTNDVWLLVKNLKVGDIIVVNTSYQASNLENATYTEKYSEGNNRAYTVTADGDVELAFKKPGTKTMHYIYGLYVYRLVTSVTATITSTTEYATFSSKYALDFTGITTLTAYKATESYDTYVKLEPITGTVAANTGLVINGATTDIPVVASGDEATGNLLKPCDGSWTTLSASETGTNYVLSVQGGNAVFAPIGKTPATLRAGVAYLYVPNSSDSRVLNIVFGDEATGISNVKSATTADGQAFNLAGQRVAQPTKGLYIVNGKKVIIK